MTLQLSYETEDLSGGALSFDALLLERDSLRVVFADDTSSGLLFHFNGAAFKRGDDPKVSDSVDWQEALELDGAEELEVRDEAGRRLLATPKGIRFACSTQGISATTLRGKELFLHWQDIPGTWFQSTDGADLGQQLIIAPKGYFLPRQPRLDRSPRSRPSALAERTVSS